METGLGSSLQYVQGLCVQQNLQNTQHYTGPEAQENVVDLI
jgi:hypothetical protein